MTSMAPDDMRHDPADEHEHRQHDQLYWWPYVATGK